MPKLEDLTGSPSNHELLCTVTMIAYNTEALPFYTIAGSQPREVDHSYHQREMNTNAIIISFAFASNICPLPL